MYLDVFIVILQKNGISGELLLVLKYFLKPRKQQVVLNGQHSPWRNVNAGAPQGAIMGLLFLVYCNDLSNGIESNPIIQSFFLMTLLSFLLIHDVN